ncbi:MAG: ABC transporter permease [Lachnospiraceae bacterium]|nr:ABC transporter permease [Lachnospiraceae bacterium]
MLLGENIRMAFTSLRANKSRALLTMLGIIIGIASVIAIMTVGNSLSNALTSSMQSLGASNISVYLTQKRVEEEKREDGIIFGTVETDPTATMEDLITLEMIQGMSEKFGDQIRAISINKSVTNDTVKVGTNSADISISGVSNGYFMGNNKELLAGTYFTDQEISGKKTAAIVSESMVKKLWEVDPQEAIGKDFEVTINETTMMLTVTGVYKQEENAMISLMISTATDVYIPLSLACDLMHNRLFASFDVVAGEGVDPTALSGQIKDYLSGFYRDNQFYTIDSFCMASMVESMGDMMGAVTKAISLVAGIALLVGGIGVMNIMLVSVTERTREIGTRKALGATNASIRLQFIIESMIICLIGGTIGVGLGLGLGALGAKLMGYAASPSLGSILGSLIFSMAIGLFFGYYPANKAAMMNPIEALRYE